MGQQQRLCLIRGLLLDPPVILLDEPTSALDQESAAIVEEAAERLALEKGKTVVMANHRTYSPSLVRPVFLDLGDGGVAAGTGRPDPAEKEA